MFQRANVVPSDRRPVVGRCRRVFDALVQVFEKRQRPNVGGGVFSFDALAVVGVWPWLGLRCGRELKFVSMTHMSHAVSIPASEVRKTFEMFSELLFAGRG